MKKNQVNSILVKETKRRNIIISCICVIIVILTLALSFLLIYLDKSKNYYVTFDENSDIDYKVYLTDNSFFEGSYLSDDSKYIASLIKNIVAKFNYEVSMNEENAEFTYKYKVDATVEVKEKESDNKTLFTKTKTLVGEKSSKVYGGSAVISEDIDIDYNEYNNLINSFIEVYDLDDTYSTLTINMYVDVIGSCDELSNKENETSVISLVIPLTTKTVEINIKNNLVNKENNILLCKDENAFNYLYIVISVVLFAIALYVIYRLIKYIVVTRSAETIYEINLKKILNSYHSYIQKVSNKLEIDEKLGLKDKNRDVYKDCAFYKLVSFNDLLEIHDSINAPILMFSNEENTATFFIILNVVNKAVYVYALRVNDIKKNMEE